VIKVYRYGLLAPTENGDLVAEQISLAHRYQNKLVEIELDRRVRYRSIIGSHADINTLEQTVADRFAEYEAAVALAKEATTKQERAERKQAAKLAKQAHVAAKDELKAVKKLIREDPRIALAVEQLDLDDAAARRRERAVCNVYWGTYLLIEQAMDAARKSKTDPRFQRWDGGAGSVGVQIQHGLGTAEVMQGLDRRVRVTPESTPIPGRGGKPRPRLLLRIGSVGQDPVWAEWPIIMHRPLPERGKVKGVKVVARRVASHLQWSAHFTIELPEVPVKEVGDLAVTVDLRWSQMGDELRVAQLCDTTGRFREIMLEEEVRGQLKKATDLQSIRDRHLNTALTALSEYKDAADHLPEEFKKRSAYSGKWQSQQRLAGLVLWWVKNRHDGDAEIIERLEAWRSHDKHLWEWEANARRKAILRRRAFYRNMSAELVRKYDRLIIERLDLSKLAKTPAPGSKRKHIPQADAQRFNVAPSELRSACIEAFQAAGRPIDTVEPGPAATLMDAWKSGVGIEPLEVKKAGGSRFKKKKSEAV
jgi:hypothetical protein